MMFPVSVKVGMVLASDVAGSNSPYKATHQLFPPLQSCPSQCIKVIHQAEGLP